MAGPSITACTNTHCWYWDPDVWQQHMKRSRALSHQNVISRGKKKRGSKKRCKTQSHAETASQSLSLCHIYYCYLNASANQENNYGNTDFSQGFQTLFLRLSYLPQHLNAFPLKSAACHCLCRLSEPGGASPNSSNQSTNTSPRFSCPAPTVLGWWFWRSKVCWTARVSFFARLLEGANKACLCVLNTCQSPNAKEPLF